MSGCARTVIYRGDEPLEIAVLAHPLIRGELEHVVASGIGQEHDDDVVGLGVDSDLDGCVEREAGRTTDENPLLTGELSRGNEALALGDLDEVIDDVAVEGARPEVLADALDLVRSDLAAVDGTFGVCADHPHRRVLLLQVSAHPADRAAGADAGAEGRDPA